MQPPWIRVTLAILLISASAAAEPLAPLEAYGALPEASLMAISPSGSRVAYRSTTDEHDAILVVDRESGEMVGGAPVGDIGPRRLLFVDDDNLIAVAGRTRRMYGYLGAFDFSAAFHYSVSKKQVRVLLARAEDLYPGQSGLGRIIGVTDGGKRVLMPAFQSEDARVVEPSYGVFSVHLDRKRARLIEDGSQRTIDWFAGADGELLARVDFFEDQDRYVIRSMRDTRKPIYELETDIPPTGPVGVLPSGDALVYASRPAGSEFLAYYRMDLADGELTGPVFGRDDASVEVVQRDINQVVHGVQYAGFLPSYEFFDEALERRVRAVQKALEGTATTLVGWSDGFRDLVFQLSGGWNSGVYILFAEGATEPELLAMMRPDIVEEQVVPTEMTSYAARDGLEIPALVTAWPALREDGNAPLVVIPHGGPQAYDRFEFDWMAQYFASRGYVVLQPQFRGSSGFGWPFARAGRGEWGGKMQGDIDDGVDHLVKSGLVDPDRVCIVGASYGGYAALAAGAFSPGKYRCVASIAGIADLERMLKSDRRKYGRDHWAISYWERQYGGDAFDWGALKAISPVEFAASFQAPVLLVHGSKDTVVPVEQSKVMRNALRKADKDVTYVELDNEDHWLSFAESRLETLRAVAAFIDEQL